MKILITGGGSTEKIDNVRSICNFSSGKTSSFLADFFAKNHEVTCLMAKKAIKPEKCTVFEYESFDDFSKLLEENCKNMDFDLIIHGAAVSDFSVESVIVGQKEYKAGTFSKIDSENQVFIKLKKNPKLICSIKKWCKNEPILIGFKLTSDATFVERQNAVKKLFNSFENQKSSANFVISNDLSEINEENHFFNIFDSNLKIVANGQNLMDLATEISTKILCKGDL